MTQPRPIARSSHLEAKKARERLGVEGEALYQLAAEAREAGRAACAAGVAELDGLVLDPFLLRHWRAGWREAYAGCVQLPRGGGLSEQRLPFLRRVALRGGQEALQAEVKVSQARVGYQRDLRRVTAKAERRALRLAEQKAAEEVEAARIKAKNLLPRLTPPVRPPRTATSDPGHIEDIEPDIAFLREQQLERSLELRARRGR